MELTKEELLKMFDEVIDNKLKTFEDKIKANTAVPFPKSDLTINDKKDLEMEFRKYMLNCLTGKIEKDVSGTYIVPTIMAKELLKLALDKSIFLQKAKVYAEPTGLLSVPYTDPTYMNPINGYYGGMIVYDVASSITESQPVFKSANLIARGYGAYIEIPRKLLTSTSFNLNSSLVDMFTDSLSWFIDYKCINGAGTTEPLGVLNSSAKLTVSRGSAGHVGMADLAGLYAKLMTTGSETGLVYMCHPTVYTDLLTLATGNHWVFVDPVTKKLDMRIFGIPVMRTTSCAALGSAGDVILSDLNAYGILLQEGISIYASEHFKFQSELISMKGVCYFDGQPLVANYATVGSSQYMSPIVALS